ncbi:MAG: peptidoglycan DD-metalloendopeptidase family protein [Phototrophicales bacterium]|nr:peptidoglycan DD-metalloendopeptidase family protein [Phototrophicales bacterium]
MRKRQSSSAGVFTVVIFFMVFGAFGLLLYNNAQGVTPVRVIIPSQAPPTQQSNTWQEVLQAGFSEQGTAFPTIEIPTQQFIAPTLPPVSEFTMTPFSAVNVVDSSANSQFSLPSTPTIVAQTPTPQPAQTGTPIVVAAQPQVTLEWMPPPLSVPQNRDPLGRDHYIFARPIDSNGVSRGLFYYPYGADGLEDLNPLRIHHGVDFPNPTGSPVRAAGSGIVQFASTPENPVWGNSASYGNVVIIEHDFGWDGLPLFTLYAHLEQSLVSTGDVVAMGDVIALSGNTGRSLGPHLHFEVRLGSNGYGDTVNPILWTVPFVGHGTIAGRLVDSRGNFIPDSDVTLRNYSSRWFEGTTTTYIFDGTVNQVNSDPNWDENFIFGDVPAGRYEVISVYDGQRLSRIIDVYEGLTTSVELRPAVAATAQPVAP